MAVAPWCVLFIVLVGCLLKPLEHEPISVANADGPAVGELAD
jgi:hypothetical protein